MNPINVNQTIQFAAWVLALAGLIIGLYIFSLNPKNSANRSVGIFLLISSLNTYAVGTMVTAITALQASYSAVILAMTTSMTEPLLLLTSVALLRPAWLTWKKKWVWYPVYLLIILPIALTLIDLVTEAKLWFTGIDPATYPGGFLISPEFTNGSISWFVRAGFILSFIIIFVLLIYIALIDKRSSKNERNLAWLLLIQQILAGAALTYLAQVILPSITILITNTIFVVTYAFAAFSRMIATGNPQTGTLQSRLSRVVFIVAIPVMVASTALMIDHTRQFFEQNAYQKLTANSNQLSSAILDELNGLKYRLMELAAQEEIQSMETQRQFPLLNQFQRLNPDINLVGIVDLNGQLSISNRTPSLRDFSTMEWFRRIKSGKHIAFQAITDNTFGEPALITAVPIRSSTRQIVGALYSITGIDNLTQALLASNLSSRGRLLVFDDHNELVTSLEKLTSDDPSLWENYPPLNHLRDGISGPISYEDNQGERWRAKSELLPNGWVVIFEYPEMDLLGPLMALTRLGWISLIIATSLLVLMSVLMIRHTIRPIRELTHVATAASEGDLSQLVVIESEDEIGELAQSINKMTNKVNSLIGNLEHLVAERTADLEQRAVQLQVAAEVARDAAGIHDLKLLLDHAANLISERFGFYHAGIFLVDDANQYAVLTAASSAGGHRMLARGHKLRVGKTGIVGYVAATGQARIALDVGQDAVFFNNPDLPETRSEMAIPLKARGKVIGVLDVQSPKPAAFKSEDITILQVLADQISLAIENARLLQKSEQSLRELETLYRQQMEQAWEYHLQENPIVFRYDSLGVSAVDEFNSPAQHNIRNTDNSNYSISIPLLLRGFPIGSLELSRDKDAPPWTQHEIEVVKATSTQIALALENARLQEIERRRMHKEQLANEVSMSVQSSLDLETVMKRAVQEIGQTLKLEKVQIRLSNGNHRAAEPERHSTGVKP